MRNLLIISFIAFALSVTSSADAYNRTITILETEEAQGIIFSLKDRFVRLFGLERFGYNRTITNPATNAPLSSSIMRGELQVLENEITSFFTIYDTNYGSSVFSTTTIPWFKNGLTASSTSYLVNATVTGTLTLNTALTVANGGTGATTFTNNRVLTGNGTSAIVDEANLTFDGSLLTVAGNATTTQFTSTGAVYLATTGGKAGVASTSPWGLFSINVDGLTYPAFNIGSSTGSLFTINQAGGIELSAKQPATSTTITLDWANTPPQVEYHMGSAAFSITIINATTSPYWGSSKRIWIFNPSGSTAGARTINGIEWIGSAPTQTTTANQGDLVSCNVTRATSTTAYKVACAQSSSFQ